MEKTMEKSDYHFSFEDLVVYQKAMMFGEVVHETVKKFPVEERFELRSQFMRAADSIALNIAEGASGTDAQFNNFLGNALYSSNECVSCNTKARLRNYITFEEFEQNRALLVELSKMIISLRQKITKRINN
jgi:four helix bundle protein